jgi:colicin import membrane protein
MHLGLIFSTAFHLLLLGWALVTISKARPLEMPKEDPVEVAIISPDALTRLTKGDRQAKELETQAKENPARDQPKKEAVKPKPPPPPAAAEPPPPPPQEPAKAEPAKDNIADKIAALPEPQKAEPPPAPGPTPDDMKKLEDKIEEERKAAEAEAQRKAAEAEAKRKAAEAEAKRKAAEAEAKRKAAEADAKRKAAEAEAKRKAAFDAEKIAALIDKTPAAAQPSGSPTPPQQPTQKKGPAAGAPEGRDTRLTASEQSLLINMIVSKVKKCWTVAAGVPGADTLIVTLSMSFKQDGSLLSDPKVVGGNGSPQFQLAADNARRAVMACQPYQLPPDKYAAWRSVELDFDPRDMF